jgi:hypothetical protein
MNSKTSSMRAAGDSSKMMSNQVLKRTTPMKRETWNSNLKKRMKTQMNQNSQRIKTMMMVKMTHMAQNQDQKMRALTGRRWRSVLMRRIGKLRSIDNSRTI